MSITTVKNEAKMKRKAVRKIIRGNSLESFDVLGHPEIVIIGGKIHHFPENQPGKNR